jgi:hypothetical protein
MRAFRLKAPVASENDIEAGCITILQLHNYWFAKLHAGVFKSLDGSRYVKGVPKGTPDYVCVHTLHRGFLMEVKRPGGELSDDQKIRIEYLELIFGLPIAVVSSAEELSAFLRQHERSP